MPGELQGAGQIASFFESIFQWAVGDDGYAEWKRQRELAEAKAKAVDALKRHDWVALREHTAALERLSVKP